MTRKLIVDARSSVDARSGIKQALLIFLCVCITTLWGCRARGVFHVTVPTPERISIFKDSFSGGSEFSVTEDSLEEKHIEVVLSRTLFEPPPGRSTPKTCGEVISARSDNEALISSESLTITDSPGGCLVSFKPNPNASGNLTVRVFSVEYPKDTVTVGITIEPVNDPPAIDPLEAVTILEDTVAITPLRVMDDSPNMECRSRSILATSSSQGVIADSDIFITGVFPDCILTYKPIADASGQTNITLTIFDGEYSDSKIFSVTVVAVNDAPVVVSNLQSQTIDEDTGPHTLDVIISDAEETLSCSQVLATASNQTLFTNLQVQGASSPAGSTTASQTLCALTFTLSPNQNGTSAITLRVSDSNLSFSEKTFTLSVGPINDAPTLSPISSPQITLENNPLSIALSLFDQESGVSCSAGSLSYSSTDPSLSSLVQSVSYSGTLQNCTALITPVPNASGNVSLTVTVSDGKLTAAQTFTFTVTPVNDPPQITAIANQTTPEDNSSPSISFSVYDVDTVISCNMVTAASNAPTLIDSSGISISGGAAKDCGIVLSPKLNQSGSAEITLSLTDGSTATDQKFTFTVTPVPDAPTLVLVGSNLYSINEDAPVFNISLGSYTDVDTDQTALNYKIISQPNRGSLGTLPSLVPSTGTSLLSYTVSPNANGTDTLVYAVCDGSAGTGLCSDPVTVTITLIPQNDPPTNVTLSNSTLNENSSPGALVGLLSAVDPDLSDVPADTHTFTLPGSGSSDNSSFYISGNALRMVSSADFEVKSSYNLNVRVTDAGGLFFDKPMTVNILDFNDAPTLSAVASPQITQEDTPLSLSLALADQDGGITCSGNNLSHSSPDPGFSSLVQSVTYSGDLQNCTALITPMPNASGTASITVALSDGILSASRSFSFTVTAVNDPPQFLNVIGNQTIAEDTDSPFYSFSVTDLETTVSCDQVTITTDNLGLIDPSSGISKIGGSSQLCAVLLRPSANQSGSALVTLSLSDGSTTTDQTFTLTVSPVNDPPSLVVAGTNTYTVFEDAPSFNVSLGSYEDVDSAQGNLNYKIVSQPIFGSLGALPSSVPNGGNAALTYTPSLNANGTDTFVYGICDGASGTGMCSPSVTVSITITAVNDAPTIAAIANQVTAVDTPKSIAVNISDVDGPTQTCSGSYLSYTSQNPAVVSSTNAMTWSGTWPNCMALLTPASQATGTSQLSISASDGSLNATPKIFTLTIAGSLAGWYQEAYLKASNQHTGSSDTSGTFFGETFGESTAIYGDTVIVGSSGETSPQDTITNGTTSGASQGTWQYGASYVYRRSGTTWSQEAYLKASNANPGDYYGSAVALHGDTAIVGAYLEASSQTIITNNTTSSADNSMTGAGAAYVYKRTGLTWAQEAYLKASNAVGYSYFGSSVSVSGDTAVIGATAEGSSQTTITNGTSSSTNNLALGAGASYVYHRTGSTWTQQAYLKAYNSEGDSISGIGDGFGSNVAISGDTIIVGAPGEDSSQTTITNGTTADTLNASTNAGASYIFNRNGTAWKQQAYFKAPHSSTNQSFGSFVAISGDTALVGAIGENSSLTTIINGSVISSDALAANAGAAYVFRRTGANWNMEAYLKAPNAEAFDTFGFSGGLSSDTIVIGAYNESSDQTTITNSFSVGTNNAAQSAGAAYVFKRNADLWSGEAYLKASNASADALYGAAVGISGDTVAIGAKGESSAQTTITNGNTSSSDSTTPSAGAVYLYRNLSRVFEVSEISQVSTTSSFTVSWVGTHLGSGNGSFKVVYATTTPSANCSSGSVAYIGPNMTAQVSSGLSPGQTYIVRICVFDGSSYSEGITSTVTIKGDDVAPSILSINRGNTSNPVPLGIGLIDFTVTFSEAVIGVSADNFSFTEVTTTKGATGKVSSVSCAAAVCTVWVIPGNTGELRLDLSQFSNITDLWGNQLASTRIGDQSYTLSGGWYQEAYIKASNAGSSDSFSKAIKLSGDTAIVGVKFEDSSQITITNGSTSSINNSLPDSGAAYIYQSSGSVWSQEAYIKADNSDSSDYFGSSVSISGDMAIVGAPNEDSNQAFISIGTGSSANDSAAEAGAGYVFTRTFPKGPEWVLEAYLKPSNTDTQDQFGTAVDVSGDFVVVGAPFESSPQTTITNGSGSNTLKTMNASGAGFLFKRTPTSGVQTAYLKASNATADAYFGSAVAISGDTVVVGAFGDSTPDTTITNGISSSVANPSIAGLSGAGYIFRSNGAGSWSQEAYLKASNNSLGDRYGAAVAISGDTVAVGARFEDSSETTITNGTQNANINDTATSAGAVYIYRRSGSQWAQEAYAKASNSEPYDLFGVSIALSGNTAVIGANFEDSSQTMITNGTSMIVDNLEDKAGAAYILKRTGSQWSQEAYIKASNAQATDYFGETVTISADTFMVGAWGEDSNQTIITNTFASSADNSLIDSGAIYVYRNTSRHFEPEVWTSNPGPDSITLNWSNRLGSANGVKIAPAVSGNSTPPSCSALGTHNATSTTTSYSYIGLQPSTKYGFRVCSFDGVNIGEGTVIWANTTN